MGICKIHIKSGGLFSTLQDSGRFGLYKEGLPQSGALDQRSMALANWLVGNAENHPVIEMTQIGMQFTIDQNLTIGFAGAEAEVLINDQRIDTYKTILLKKNDRIRIRHFTHGMRLYLAFKGDLVEAKMWNSYSTYNRAQIGLNNGNPFRKGDTIELVPCENSNISRNLPEEWRPKWNQNIIRFCAGPEWDFLDQDQKKLIEKPSFIISQKSDRMGILLDGPEIQGDSTREMISSLMAIGVIQLPPSGQPIITLNDGQTIGGYPRIGFIAGVDIKVLAQMKFDQNFSFRLIDSTESNRLIRYENTRLNNLFCMQEN